jgi:hypothetical protein
LAQVGLDGGPGLLGPLLMFFQVLSNLSLVMILSRLHERPIVIALCALAGGAVNALLAYAWLEGGTLGAARAAGVGLYLGGGEYIHDNGRDMRVAVNSFEPASPRYRADLDRSFAGARRIIGVGN